MKKKKLAMALAIAMTLSSLEIPAALVQAEEISFTAGTEEAGSEEARTEEVFGDGNETSVEESFEENVEGADYLSAAENVNDADGEAMPAGDGYGMVVLNGYVNVDTTKGNWILDREYDYLVHIYKYPNETRNVSDILKCIWLEGTAKWDDDFEDDIEVFYEEGSNVLAAGANTHFIPYLEDEAGNRYGWNDTLSKEGIYYIGAECMEYEVSIGHYGIKVYFNTSDVHTHIWSNCQVITPPTCGGMGKKIYTCAVCGKTYEDTIGSTGHIWSAWTVSVPATDTAPGEETRTCTVCGTTKTRELTEHIDYKLVKGSPFLNEEFAFDWNNFRSRVYFNEEGIKASEILKVLSVYVDAVYNPVTNSEEWLYNMSDDRVDFDTEIRFNNGDTAAFCSSHIKVYLEDSAGIQYGWDDVITKEGIYNIKAKCLEYDVTMEPYGDSSEIELISKNSIPHTHTWTEWKVTTPATCTKAGVETHTCVCGETETREIQATGHTWSDWTVTTPATCTKAGVETRTCVCGEKETRELPATGHTWGDWTVTTPAACTTAGTETRTCACGETETRELPATGHTWGQWTTAEAATVFAPEKQQRICASCGFAETQDNGTALTPTVKVNVNTKYALPMKTRQVFTTLKVSGLANGDSVASWKSSNTKIVTVKGKADGTCKITARRAGKAAITVTLASGKNVSIKISVKNAAVKTSSITGVPSKMTLKKGQRASLTPSVLPITSREKVTYTSSNKKVVTVDSKGRMKAVNPGTAKITVKSGSKRKTCTVKVTGIPAESIKYVPSTLTLKRGKTKALKPKLYPAGCTDKVTYKSSNTKVAAVSSKGVIKAGKKKGTAYITVKAGKKYVKCKVTVK